jgi:hypothetical protein
MTEIPAVAAALAAQALAELGDELDPQAVNTGARFLPQTPRPPGAAWDSTRPCLTVAGFQVYAYVDPEGCLVVSVDTETTEMHYGPTRPGVDADRPMPVRINLDSCEVHARQWPIDLDDCLCTYRTDDRGQTTLVRRDPDCEVPNHAEEG